MAPLLERAIFTTGKLSENAAPVKGERSNRLSKGKDASASKVAVQVLFTLARSSTWFTNRTGFARAQRSPMARIT